MYFDSHVRRVLEAAVDLVNVVTPGEEGGRSHVVLEGEELRARLARALATAGRPLPRVTRAQSDDLVAMAMETRPVFVAAAAGDVDDAAARANRLLRTYGARPQLDHTPGEGWSLHFHGPDDSLVVGWGAGIATGLAIAIGSDLAGRLGVCSAPGCDRVYVDESRNGGRRFCSTRCQNRVKAATHRARGRGSAQNG